MTRPPHGLDDDAMEEIREIFSHFDRDGNGTIDAQEFESLLKALGADMPQEEMDLGLSLVDRDGNGTVEFDEFVAWWAGSR